MVRCLLFAPAMAYAAVCTPSDLMPIASSAMTCSSASGVTAAQLQGADAVTNAIKLCQYPACQAFFASLASLKCTDAAGNPVSGASGVCSALPKSTAVSTFLASGAGAVALAVAASFTC
ncbi:hypothetical protein H257_10992 [Aphanomyces astaci]|uniref:Secreted protein n=1 Tax=Aphanomyces astaci TaxID=112090 RepID=W4G3W2_APHAT|nr:hypothetical protein H257_10992 [Aphanomyces astaci]ETV74402.1 hypothetical protein H257_10992 [Aphanomyces astaci]|eukprot:XP_009836060.1 hypothetical protein H257_10992 [Aphanomyces astaci]